jgi:hypothetical protein
MSVFSRKDYLYVAICLHVLSPNKVKIFQFYILTSVISLL